MKYLLLTLFFTLSFNTYAKDAQRIIALSPHSVEMLFAIGAGDRIVGTVEYADYPKAALDIKRIGSYAGLQIESVIELRPDLVVGWKSGNKLTDLNKLESLGLNIVYSHPKNITEIRTDLIILGELTGLQENAQKIADGLYRKHQKLISAYSKKDTVKVFYQLWDDPLRTVGSDSWVESLINDCNGVNIFDDASASYPLVSLESVLIKNPQVIIVQHHKKEDETKKKIWKRWKMIEAVKNGHLFTMNPDILLRPTPRALDGLRELCKVIDKAR